MRLKIGTKRSNKVSNQIPMNTLRTLFKDMETRPKKVELQSELFLAIESLKNSQLKRRMQISYAGLFLSGAGTVFAGFTYGGTFAQSEFWSVVSLFFSDAHIVASYWNEFFLLLMETIPIVPILLILIPTFVFLLFLSMFFKTTQRHRYSY